MSDGLRQRLPPAAPAPAAAKASEETPACYGKTPDGTLFQIPQTHDMLSSLFDPRLPKSNVDVLTLSLLALQVVLFLALPLQVSRYFFMGYFACWRLAYNAGLGYVLNRQSEERWIVKTVVLRGWMDAAKRPLVKAWIERELRAKMGKDYDFDAVPLEYNVWIMFRHFVDVILLNDFLSYCFFAFSFLQFPPGHSVVFHVLRWIGGAVLVLFNLWVKVDAHRIVKDYAWYWGDAFFASMQDLVFDGVFEFAPHPMYSVGYAGYYGLSLIVASETVLFVSLAAHACQFGFLVYFENPHIERTYGSKKPLAARIPLASPLDVNCSLKPTSPTEQSPVETSPTTPTDSAKTSVPSGLQTRHDLDNRYFAKDLIIFKNFDLFRSRDLAFAVALFYSFWMTLPSFGPTTQLILAFANALMWRMLHTFGLGLALKAQSETKWIVRHFVKCYHYEREDGAVDDAFDNWKATYNFMLCMSYSSFIMLAWRCYTIPSDWTVGSQLVRHALGLLLICLHIWTASSTYEVLGPFGWFYGDFFIQDYPTELYYTGIYRFLNNPERSMGGAAFFGFVLICGSKLLLTQAVIAVLAHWWFLSVVENSHMKRLYGNSLRKDAGVTKTLKAVVSKNVNVFSGLSKSVQEVHGTFEKVFEETAEAVEIFLQRTTPKLHGYVEDTKVFLEQSGERLVISRVANDMAAFDRTQYSISVLPPAFSPAPLVPHASGSNGPSRFHLGEPISVDWRAPSNHSRKDWIGIYRLGANKDKLITTVSSQGRWCGVRPDEWKGDAYRGSNAEEEVASVGDSGKITFSGKKLPWHVGVYEIRYHHNAKHNVMALSTLVEIYVDSPADVDDPVAVKSTLNAIVAKTLSLDIRAIPASSHHLIPPTLSTPIVDPTPLSDPDDFVIYSLDEAQHIAYAIKIAFDVELGGEVVLAAANVAKLAHTIQTTKKLLRRSSRGALAGKED